MRQTHDVTDPMAPLGYQCGDAACEWHGLARMSPFNSSAPMTEPVPGGTIVTIEINQEQPEEKVETTETTETETETTEKVEVTEKPADADEDE